MSSAHIIPLLNETKGQRPNQKSVEIVQRQMDIKPMCIYCLMVLLLVLFDPTDNISTSPPPVTRIMLPPSAIPKSFKRCPFY